MKKIIVDILKNIYLDDNLTNIFSNKLGIEKDEFKFILKSKIEEEKNNTIEFANTESVGGSESNINKLSESNINKKAAKKIFIDGASRNNPGEAGCGVAIHKDDNIYDGYYYYLGKQTNNYAEYMGLIKALELSIDKGFDNIEIYTDSQLMSKQVIGEYKIKNSALSELNSRVIELSKKINNFHIEYIPRENNKLADRLSNMAIDRKNDGKIELRIDN